MSPTPRSRRLLLWISGGLVVVLLGGALSAGAVFLASSTGPSGDAAPVASSTPGATVPAEDTGSWVDDLPVPPGATEEERRQVELTYSLVAVDDDRADTVREAASGAIGAQSVDGLTYFAVPAAEIDAVRTALPDAEVTPNRIVETEADQSPAPSWGLDAVDTAAGSLDTHYFFDSSGAGATAYVVDTGVQADHPDFHGRVDAAAGHDEVGDGRGTDDCHGHGTHVAGTIGSTTYGVAKQVRIVPVRVLPCDGKGTYLSLVYGLMWIYRNNSGTQAVINMSIGGMPTDTTINRLVRSASSRGFVVVSAAGNETEDACSHSPASAPEGITVGAVDSALALAWYSNFGSCVTLLAPGSDITSTYIGSTTAVLSGTSMATPHVAGLAARLVGTNPSWKTAQVKAALVTTAATGHLTGLPSGTPNVLAAILGVPRLTSLTATAGAAGIALAWATNDIGTFTTFSLTVTDTTTGREYPVVVSGVTMSTVFTDVVATHTYRISATATVRMPTATVTTNTLSTSYTAGG